MNIMTKEFKKLISNNQDQLPSRVNDNDFVTHQELSLVYSDIKDDFQNMDKKFTLEFVKVKQEFVDVRREIRELDEKLTSEIRKTREEAHVELIEVKNEIISSVRTIVRECLVEHALGQ